jgi:hypothetical protein
MSVTKVTGMMQTSTKGGDITSASPCVIDSDGDYFDIAGTVSFAAFTVTSGRRFTVQFDGVLTMTHHATTLDLPGGANITTAAGDVAEFFATGTNTVQCVNYTKADGTAVVAAGGGAATGFIGGLKCSNDTDASHDILISVGSARDYGDAVTMTLGTAITKRIDATWAVGDDNGGLDTGSVGASTGYGVYLIRRSDTGVVDVMFSVDMTASLATGTLPTNYDQKRLIGWVQTDSSSNIIAFTQVGDYFRLTGDILSVLSDATITSSTYESVTMTTPPLCMAHFYGGHRNTSTSGLDGRVFFRTSGAADDSSTDAEAFCTNAQAAAFDRSTNLGMVLTNSSSAIEYTALESNGTATVQIKLLGCLMLTRSNP